MRKLLQLGILVIVLAATLSSCNLEDFDFDKLTEPKDLTPTLYAPLAYGTYLVDNLVNITLPDHDPVTAPVLTLDSIVYDLGGTNYRYTAVDSAYLVVNLTNGTPMKFHYRFAFVDQPSGTILGQTFDSGIIQSGKADATGAVTEPLAAKNIFKLGPTDLDNLDAADSFVIWTELEQPDSGTVTVKNLNDSEFKVQLYFYAPVDLTKLDD